MITMLLMSLAHAGSLAGVTVPDQVTVGGQSIPLNGIGLREKYFIDVYVGALYLATPTSSDSAAIAADEPKRMVMHFVYGDVPADKLRATFREGFANAGATGMDDKIAMINGWMSDMTTGDEVVMDYVPGEGTTVTVKGVKKGTIEGADFMRTLFGVYLGPNPPTAKLKRGLLSG